MNQPRPDPDPSLPPLRVIAGGARKGRAADHLKRADRPVGRFWDDAQPAAAAATAPTPAPVFPAAPAPAAGMAELLAFMTAQTALMQELLSEQRRLRQRIEQLERDGAGRPVDPPANPDV